ncbi:SCO family protein [Reichenbachiella agariperforans]|nr:SCO family protein [Reichenbachiella agariperforans]
MMKYSIIISVCTWLLGCSAPQQEQRINAEIELPFYTEETFTPTWIDEDDDTYDSIHQIAPFSFIDQEGNTITDETMKGKVYVANFFFSICPGVCPKMAHNLHLVQEKYATDDRVKILSHTVMPWVDSVARLQEYATLNQIHADQWHLLTGDKTKIYELARNSYFADEGFGKTVTTEEDFLHTEKLILIDSQRRIRGVYNGTLPLDVKRMMEDISTLLD